MALTVLAGGCDRIQLAVHIGAPLINEVVPGQLNAILGMIGDGVGFGSQDSLAILGAMVTRVQIVQHVVGARKIFSLRDEVGQQPLTFLILMVLEQHHGPRHCCFRLIRLHFIGELILS